MLSQTTLIELKTILAEEFNLSTSNEEVSEIAAQLVGFAEVLKEINDESLCPIVIK